MFLDLRVFRYLYLKTKQKHWGRYLLLHCMQHLLPRLYQFMNFCSALKPFKALFCEMVNGEDLQKLFIKKLKKKQSIHFENNDILIVCEYRCFQFIEMLNLPCFWTTVKLHVCYSKLCFWAQGNKITESGEGNKSGFIWNYCRLEI